MSFSSLSLGAEAIGFGKEGYNIVAGSINFGLSHPEILGALEGPVGKFLAIGIKVYNFTHSMPLQLPLMTIHAGAEEAGSLVFDVASLAIPLKGGLVRSGSTLLGRMFTGGMERFGFFKRGFNSLVVSNITKGLSANPFKGKSFEEIDVILTKRGFKKVGPDPISGKGYYFNPETGRKYYLDKGGIYKEGVELPHIDVHKMDNGVNLESVGKRRYPLGEILIEDNKNVRSINANF